MLVSADDHLVVRLVQDLLPEHRRPEASDGSRIARVNDQLIETDGHAAMLSCRSELDLVREALDAFALRGEVLELAGGTGLWTQQLAQSADNLPVVDASPEAQRITRERLQNPRVRYLEADISANPRPWIWRTIRSAIVQRGQRVRAWK